MKKTFNGPPRKASFTKPGRKEFSYRKEHPKEPTRDFSKTKAQRVPEKSFKESSFSSKKLQTTISKQQSKLGTSWGPVATWYDKHLEGGKDTYHEKVVYPNLLRILDDVTDKHIVDLACGQGQFSRMLTDVKAKVIGVDIGKELIAIAEKKNLTPKNKFSLHYFVSSSHDLFMVKSETQDAVVCILALQNIEKLQETLKEVSRVLKSGGKFICVINHPSFRNPTHTHWGYDEHEDKQYRRVEEYLSESKVKIDMTPGSKSDKKFTVSFHRPLQVYVKALTKYGFAITRLEEWVSHRESEKGPRKRAEDRSRKEIPLFMCIETTKH
jgi:ubiquinone/menaquinone biosynthesis C-methylase UbiE